MGHSQPGAEGVQSFAADVPLLTQLPSMGEESRRRGGWGGFVGFPEQQFRLMKQGLQQQKEATQTQLWKWVCC